MRILHPNPATPYLLASVSLAALFIGEVSGAIPVTDEIRLTPSADASVSYYSNFFFRDEALEPILPEESSFVYQIDPQLKLEAGDDNSKYQISVEGGAKLLRIEALPDQDRTDFHVSLNASFKGERSFWDLTGHLTESSLPTPDSHSSIGVTPRTASGLSWSGSTRLSTRSRLKCSPNYLEIEYEDSAIRNYNDYNTFSIPVKLLYSVSEDLEIGGGFRWRDRNQELGNDSTDVAWHISAETSPSSRLQLDANIGWLQTDFETNADSSRSDLFVSASARWAASEHTSFFLKASSDSNPSSYASSVLRERVEIGAGWAPRSKWRANVSAALEKEDYESNSRVDDLIELTGQLQYAFTEQGYLAFSLSYLDNDSNRFGLDYQSLIVSGNTGWRF